jgi:flagellin-like protein
MKKLRKIRKNAKALSPVVASIILIAVTVAVSIAVAAWMGALTVGFMGSSSVTITDAAFNTSPANTTTLSVKNTGTKTVTMTTVKINGGSAIAVDDAEQSLAAGETGSINLDLEWIAGNPYKFDIYDGSGQVVGSYQATPPN